MAGGRAAAQPRRREPDRARGDRPRRQPGRAGRAAQRALEGDAGARGGAGLALVRPGDEGAAGGPREGEGRHAAKVDEPAGGAACGYSGLE